MEVNALITVFRHHLQSRVDLLEIRWNIVGVTPPGILFVRTDADQVFSGGDAPPQPFPDSGDIVLEEIQNCIHGHVVHGVIPVPCDGFPLGNRKEFHSMVPHENPVLRRDFEIVHDDRSDQGILSDDPGKFRHQQLIMSRKLFRTGAGIGILGKFRKTVKGEFQPGGIFLELRTVLVRKLTQIEGGIVRIPPETVQRELRPVFPVRLSEPVQIKIVENRRMAVFLNVIEEKDVTPPLNSVQPNGNVAFNIILAKPSSLTKYIYLTFIDKEN